MRQGWLYILSNRRDGTLYVGVTSDLRRRLAQHRSGTGSAFVRRHGLHRLVYAERHELVAAAIQREKLIKSWPRAWKVRLIHSINSDWHDLADDLFDA